MDTYARSQYAWYLPMQASGTLPRSNAARQVKQIGTIASSSPSGKHLLHTSKLIQYSTNRVGNCPLPVSPVEFLRLLLEVANGACCDLQAAFVMESFKESLDGLDLALRRHRIAPITAGRCRLLLPEFSVYSSNQPFYRFLLPCDRFWGRKVNPY